MCPYCEVGSYLGFCNCLASGQYSCMFVYRCTAEHRWKALPEMENCLLMKEKMGVRDLKPTEHKVRFESGGKLYVEVDDMVYKIDNPFDHTPQGVEIERVDGHVYVKGYAPKVEPLKEKPHKTKSKKKSKK